MKLKIQHLIIVMVIIAIIAMILPKVMPKENFANSYNLTLDDYSKSTRNDYISIGKRRYNRFADPQDVFRPGLADSIDASNIDLYDNGLKDVLTSIDLIPSTDSKTLLGPYAEKIKEKLPPTSAVLKEAKKCEAHKTRDSCSILGEDDTKNCGVCIKGGTDVFQTNPDKHIGGLLSLKMDRELAEQEAIENKTLPVYQPTVGGCPAGFFFVDKATCEKEVNRLNCKESGQSGGFTGITLEGKKIAEESCANCPASGDSVFIYEPNKPRKFSVNIRAITPLGTGRNIIRVVGADGTLITEARAVGGEEILIQSGRNMVGEGDELTFLIYQEFPHRPRGQAEVFHVDRGETEMAKLNRPTFADAYGYTRETAALTCKNLGALQATKAQLQTSQSKGAQYCRAGHTSDFSGYPMQGEMKGCGVDGLNDWGTSNDGFAGAWCYGIKPPTGRYVAEGYFDSVISPFFNSYGENINPSQADQPTQNSQFGIDYAAPYYHGVILQWESATPSNIRRIALESTITTIMDQAPSTLTMDGYKTFKLLRRMGTYRSSQMILSPKPVIPSKIITNQYWLWSNDRNNTLLKLTAKVPGTLTNTYYDEDQVLCPAGPIIGNKATFDLLKISPCAMDGQEPGKYSLECLKSLFISAGGNVEKGILSPKNGEEAIKKITFDDETKKPLDQDQIIDKLTQLYNVATTGRDEMGLIVGGNNRKLRRKLINDAAMAMFGLELVTACEDVEESAKGDILIVQKSGPFDSDCLDYLYTNAGSNKSRGSEEEGRKTGIKSTYISIGDKYSGIKADEMASKDMKETHPFQTCQRSGSLAPIDKYGKTNAASVMEANSKGSTIRAVQDFYNSVFSTANADIDEGTPEEKLSEKMDQQSIAMKKCYGVDRIDDSQALTGCGIPARYVRVLRTLNGSASDGYNCWDSIRKNNIQISQLKVFDAKNNEVAQGKQTRARTTAEGSSPDLAVDGRGPRKGLGGFYIDNDDAAPHTEQFWMVDLGKVYEVKRVEYYNRLRNSDPRLCLRNSSGAVVQLLDKDRRVIAQKVLSIKAEDQETLNFSKEDAIMPLSPGKLRPGMKIMLETAATKNSYLYPKYGPSHRAYNAGTDPVSQTQNYGSKDGVSMYIRKGKYDDTFTFESVKDPNMFLAYYYGNVIFAESWQNNEEAQWVIRPALNGAPGYVSIENKGASNLYITATNQWVEGYVGVRPLKSTSPPGDLVLASWRIRATEDV